MYVFKTINIIHVKQTFYESKSGGKINNLFKFNSKKHQKCQPKKIYLQIILLIHWKFLELLLLFVIHGLT